jgi:predicted SPOUT superfamily RNA methylase MTH1
LHHDRINARLTPDIRCTVQIDPEAYKKPGQMKGTVVSPSAPREHDGTYWGYTTRLASSIKAALDECPYEGGYDLKIGTSERGDSDMEKKEFTLPSYKHALIVFGGPNGIEECVDADETLKLPGAQSKKLFDLWVNICPFQGSRTIRSEEAVLIGLAKFSPLLAASASRKSDVKKPVAAPPQVEFTDDEPSSEESSEESVGSEEE